LHEVMTQDGRDKVGRGSVLHTRHALLYHGRPGSSPHARH